jgi:flagellar biosynthesis chaperone FliJ
MVMATLAENEKELKKAKAKLIKEYRWRQRRYSQNVSGIRSNGNNCWNEQNMADQISRLEQQVEDLGGDSYECLKEARLLEDKKCSR